MKFFICILSTCCLSFMVQDTASPENSISFYTVNLVCNAASDIGCGSRAKPVLADLQKNPSVKEAWLNHAGTVIAIVWREDHTEQEATAIFAEHKLQFTQLVDEEHDTMFTDFENGQWYRGNDVDALSIIEAGRIAQQMIDGIEEEMTLTSDVRQAMYDEFENYVKDAFLSLENIDDMYQSQYWQQWEKDLTAIGEKYLGDDMTEIKIVSGNAKDKESCSSKSNCCSKDEKSNCCSKPQKARI